MLFLIHFIPSRFIFSASLCSSSWTTSTSLPISRETKDIALKKSSSLNPTKPISISEPFENLYGLAIEPNRYASLKDAAALNLSRTSNSFIIKTDAAVPSLPLLQTRSLPQPACLCKNCTCQVAFSTLLVLPLRHYPVFHFQPGHF